MQSLRRQWPWGLAFMLVIALALALVWPIVSVRSASQIICVAGTGAGECSDPGAVAIDREEGILYVADTGNDRIEVFDAETGAPIDSFGGVDGPRKIAVDNDPLSTARGDVYVADSSQTVKRFDPVGALELTMAGSFESIEGLAVGPGGVVYVVDAQSKGGGEFEKRVQRFSHAGVPVGPALVLDDEPLGAIRGFAVDSGGSFYLANDGAGGSTPAVRKYDASGTLLNTFHDSFNIRTLAVDAADNLLVADITGDVVNGIEAGETAVYAYTPAGRMFRVLYGGGTLVSRANSLAPSGVSPTDDVFMSEGGGPGSMDRVLRIAFEPPGPVVHPNPGLTFAEPIGNTKAALNAWINPEGKASAYRFEYVDDAIYQEDIASGGTGFEHALSSEVKLVPETAMPDFAPPAFGLAPVSAQIGCQVLEDPPQASCLTPETGYHFRAVAENADGGPRFGPEATFSTKAPFEITEAWSTGVGPGAVLLHTTVDPLGIPLSGRFEYVAEATYLADVAAGGDGFERTQSTAQVDFGSGDGPVTASAQLHSLAPGTAYRYRIVVENAFGREGKGEALAFRTFSVSPPPQPCANDALRPGSSGRLPDCRAYEMVSPVDKEGGDIAVPPSPALQDPAEIVQSAATVPAEGLGITYSSSRAFGDAASAPFASQYIAIRHPLGHPGEGWRSHGISPRREGAPFYALEFLDTQYKAFSEDLRYGWLRSDSEPPLEPAAIAGFGNLYRHDNSDDSHRAICPVKPPGEEPVNYVPEPQGASADSSTTVFRANDALTAEASSKAGIFQLYACTGGVLRLVSVLPPALGGGASEEDAAAGTKQGARGDHREDSLHNAVSLDGSRIYWSASEERNIPGRIYLRERPFAAGGECSSATSPCTRAVSEAVGGPGSEAPAEFWAAADDGSVAIFGFVSGPLAGNLYEFDAEVESGSTELIAQGVRGVAGTSEDASRLYFVSTQALAPGAEAGKANLYLRDASKGAPRLVAVLPGGASAGACGTIDQLNPIFRCTRAAPDGLSLAFVSSDPLTGYDNKDAASGLPTSQVFLYDASAKGGAGELLCVSCNPSGGRPAGRQISGSLWEAARIPGWEHAFHASRALSADGRRLFFEAYDSLVSQDTNGARDVYQWEAAGNGGCEVEDHDYSPQNGGCLSLISSGEDPRDSEFLDASAGGSDVFFKTAESLMPQDPGLIDIYDARIGGGFPPPPEPVPGCEGEACQSPPAPPQASPPSSSSFHGPESRKGKLRCPKAKARGRAFKKSSCKKGSRRGKRARSRRPKR
jgi:DNA-binding beta-propeller fold protein YncE